MKFAIYLICVAALILIAALDQPIILLAIPAVLAANMGILQLIIAAVRPLHPKPPR